MVPTNTGSPSSPVGAVERLRDDRGEGGPHEGEVHFVANLLQAVLDDRQADRIEGLHVEGLV
jgi:hypothetical protein